MAKAAPDAGFSLNCIKDKKVTIAVAVVVAVLMVIIISLAAKKCLSCPSPVLSCLEKGIGYGDKCFYFMEKEEDWNRSQNLCLSFGAHLATIDSIADLRFLLRCGSSTHFWVGLQRENAGPWKWFNGSLFSDGFEIRGEGQCAYINHDGISSDWCSQMKYFVCSHLQKHSSRILKD